VLLKFISEVQDTNIIKRSDVKTLENVQNKVKDILQSDNSTDSIQKLNEEFVNLNISPGGCADLLAICFLLYFISE